MVHALEKIHGMLTTDGCLIDMHPIGQPAPVTVRLGADVHQAGWIKEEGDYEMYVQADEALETAVSNQWYQLTADETFAFITYFDTLTELNTYLAEEWKIAYLEPLVAMQIESLMQSSIAEQEIIIKEIVRITRLEPRREM